MSTRFTTGSRMPSGRSERILDTASRTSFTARSTGVPNWNCTIVDDDPSVTVEVMSLTLPIEAIADSTRWVIWVSISVGTAPGWEAITLAAGKLAGTLIELVNPGKGIPTKTW